MEDGGDHVIIALLIAGHHTNMAEAIMVGLTITPGTTITIIQTDTIQEIYTVTVAG